MLHADKAKRARTQAGEPEAPKPPKLPLRDALGPMGQALALDLDIFRPLPAAGGAGQSPGAAHPPSEEPAAATRAAFNPPFAPVPQAFIAGMDLSGAAAFAFYVRPGAAAEEGAAPAAGALEAGQAWQPWGPREARAELITAGAEPDKYDFGHACWQHDHAAVHTAGWLHTMIGRRPAWCCQLLGRCPDRACVLPAMHAGRASEAWVANAWRMVVWKLAGYEHAFPGQAAGGRALNPGRVMHQLQIRWVPWHMLRAHRLTQRTSTARGST